MSPEQFFETMKLGQPYFVKEFTVTVNNGLLDPEKKGISWRAVLNDGTIVTSGEDYTLELTP